MGIASKTINIIVVVLLGYGKLQTYQPSFLGPLKRINPQAAFLWYAKKHKRTGSFFGAAENDQRTGPEVLRYQMYISSKRTLKDRTTMIFVYVIGSL